MRKMGMSHMDVVDKLARDVVSTVDDVKSSSLGRFADMKKSI